MAGNSRIPERRTAEAVGRAHRGLFYLSSLFAGLKIFIKKFLSRGAWVA